VSINVEKIVMRTDKERLDWLETQQVSLYAVTIGIRVPTTTPDPGYETQYKFVGWSTGSRLDEAETVREAIDAAMDA